MLRIRYSSFVYFIFYIIILIPLFPKILIRNDIYVNPIEVVIFSFILFSILLFKRNVLFMHPIQKYFVLIFITEIFFTIISLINFFDISGLFKLIKYILYSSIFYIGYNYMKIEDLKKIVKIGSVSMLINILFYIYNIFTSNFSIWNIESLSSGFVNRYIDFSTMSIATIPSGAHAIWGDYCVLLLILSISLFYLKKISYSSLLFVVLLVLINLAISVARTSLMTFFIFIILSLIYHLIIKKRINGKLFFLGILVLITISISILNYYESLAMIQKVVYTLNSFLESGQESNITLRIQVWILSLYDLFLHPLHIFVGCGYNKMAYLDRLYEANIYFNFAQYPSVPESFYLEALMYGGIIALCFLCIFTFLTIYYSLSQKNILSKYFGFFFIAEVFGNLFSGSAMRSDLVLFHIMLLLGFILRMKYEEKYIIGNC